MRCSLVVLLLACTGAGVFGQPQGAAVDAPPSAAEVMARVAANQDASEAERAHYVYVQHARVTSRKGKSVRCEEITDSRVTPSESGSYQELLKLDGRLLRNKKYVTYTTLPVKKDADESDVAAGKESVTAKIDNDGDMDRDLVEHLRTNFTNDRSKDGIGAGLFPLTSKAQGKYAFKLMGRERMNGRDVFHIVFAPAEKDEFGWKGDAYIDSSAYQPVMVRTAMARKVPFAVRTLLGTNVPGLGFTVIYAPQPGGVWFPVSFGTEFKIHVLFFYSREMVISAENREFEKTHVSATILPAVAAEGRP